MQAFTSRSLTLCGNTGNGVVLGATGSTCTIYGSTIVQGALNAQANEITSSFNVAASGTNSTLTNRAYVTNSAVGAHRYAQVNLIDL